MKLEIDISLDRGPDGLRVAQTIDAAVAGVYGPSGAGKTTLLHAVAGLVPACRGRIVLDGRTLLDSGRRLFVPPHKRHIGVAFQNARLLPHYSVQGNLTFGLNRLPRERRRLKLQDVVDLLDLGGLLERHTRQLSGGEARRVALGRALLSCPSLLLLDEPLASLDEPLRYQILPFLRRIRDTLDIPILIVSHLLAEILELTDRMLVLDHGRVLGCGTLVELAQRPEVLNLMHELGLLNFLRLVVVRAGEQGVTLCRLIGAGEGDGRRDGASGAQAGGAVLIRTASLDAPAGAEVHAVLPANAVALAIAPVSGISMQNQLPGRLERITRTPRRCLCLIDVGSPLLVEMTDAALAGLGLVEGSRVWCLFKAHGVRVLAV